MPRHKKDAKILNIKLDRTVSEQLDRYCDESGMNKTMATEKIMSQFFEEYFSHPKREIQGFLLK